MEFKKLLYKKKILLLIAVIFAIQFVFYIYTVNSKAQETDWFGNKVNNWAEQAALYGEHVEGVIKQAESMMSVGIFAQTGSFSIKNINKTKADYEKLLNVKITPVDSDNLNVYWQFSAIHGAALLCGLLIVFVYIDDNKQGLRSMLFAAGGGRGRLAIRRIGAMFIWDMALSVLFYGGTLLLASAVCGDNPFVYMRYSAQSLAVMKNFTMPWSIGAVVAAYVLYRGVVIFAVCLLVWLLAYIIDNVLISVAAAGGLGITEYFLSRSNSLSGVSDIFKYCNLWYLTSGNGFFCEYKNLRIGSNAVNKNIPAIIAAVILIAAASAAAYIVRQKRYPCKSRQSRAALLLSRISGIFGKIRNGIQQRLGIFGTELYKVLISQKGLIVVAFLIVLLVYNTDYRELRQTQTQRYYYEFMDKHTGPVSDEAIADIEKVGAHIREVDEYVADMRDKYEQGLIDFEEYSETTYIAQSIMGERKFYEMVTEQTEHLRRLKDEQGIDGWYVNALSFNHIIERNDVLVNLFLILGTILICSGIYAVEDQKGMKVMIRQCSHGRGQVFCAKMSAAFGITAVLTATALILEITSCIHVYGLSGLGAPLKSIPKLSFIEINCTLRTLLIGTYIAKALMIMAVAAISCMFSAIVGQRAAIGASLACCVPTVLSLLGYKFFDRFSLIDVISVAPFMFRVKSLTVVLITVSVFAVIGAGGVIRGYRKWSVT